MLVMISDCSGELVPDCLLKGSKLNGPVYRGQRSGFDLRSWCLRSSGNLLEGEHSIVKA